MEAGGQMYVPAAWTQEKKLGIPIEQELVWPQRRCGRFAEDRNLLRLLRIEPRFLSWLARNLVSMLTELPRIISVVTFRRETGESMRLPTKYSQTSVHESLGSWTIRFTNKFSEHKASRMMYCVSSYEHASRHHREAISWECQYFTSSPPSTNAVNSPPYTNGKTKVSFRLYLICLVLCLSFLW